MKKPHPAIRAAAAVSAIGLAALFVLYRGGAFAAPQPTPIDDPPPVIGNEAPMMISSSKSITLVTPVVPQQQQPPPAFFAGSKAMHGLVLPTPPSSAR